MAELEPIYDKKYECIYCKNAFVSKKVRSRFSKADYFDTDFCPVYAENDNNPLYYHIQVCPKCGFSFSEDFSKYFPPGSAEEIQKKLTSRWVPHDFSSKRAIHQAIQTYKLAVYCGALKKEKHISLAGLYIRIAWLYRLTMDHGQEQRFLKLAVEEYEESYFEGDYQGTPISEVRILYLIGELSRRCNNMEKAVQFFSRVIEKQRQTNDPLVIKMAKERWQEIRDNKAISQKGKADSKQPF